jgi:hypothetical protein
MSGFQVLERSGLADVLNDRVHEFIFATAAINASGQVLALKASNAAADSAVWVGMAGSTVASAGVMTAAVAAALIDRDGVQSSNTPIAVDIKADQVNIRAGLVAWADDLQSGASGTASAVVAFAVAGIEVKRPVSAELHIWSAASGTETIFRIDAAPIQIPEPVTLGTAGELIYTGTTEIDLFTNQLCWLQRAGVVFGAFKQNAVTQALYQLTANDIVKLVLRVRS